MSQSMERPQAGSRHGGSGLVNTLYVMAFIVGATALVATLFDVGVAFSRGVHVLPEEIIYKVIRGVGGVAVAILLGALGSILDNLQYQSAMMHRLARAQEDAAACLSRMASSGTQAAVPVPTAPAEAAVVQPAIWSDSHRTEQILEILHEVSENLLLTPEQRQAKRNYVLQETRQSLCEVIGRLLSANNFVEAQARLDQYAHLFPDDRQQIDELSRRIDEARAKVEQDEYEQAAAKIRDLTATASWDRAEELAQALLKRHPKSQKIHEMADAVHQEHTRFFQQHRQHMLAQIEHCSSQRQWREAYRLATELITEAGDSAEGQIVRDKLDTLKENAEIEIRRDLEDQLKELIRTHRYIEALALAQDLVGKYPGSPQAKVLRDQMPQLMSKAKLQMDQAGRA